MIRPCMSDQRLNLNFFFVVGAVCTMKPVLKMGLIALVGICVVFYQYHLSFGNRLDQINGVPSQNENADALPINNYVDGYSTTQQRITEDMASSDVIPIPCFMFS